MAELDKGFEEVPLDAGFEEVPLEAKEEGFLPRAKSIAKTVLGLPSAPLRWGVEKAIDLGKSIAGSTDEERQAGLAGTAQGASLGLLPKVTAGAESLVERLRGTSEEAPVGDMSKMPQSELQAAMKKMSPTQLNAFLQSRGFTGDIGPTSPGAQYEQNLNELNKQNEDLASASPIAYGAGQLAGGLATAIPTGGYGSAKLGGMIAGGAERGFLAAGKQGFVPFAKAVGIEAASAVPMGAAMGVGAAKSGEEVSGGLVGAVEGGLTATAVKGATELIPLAAKGIGKMAGNKLESFFKPKEGASNIEQQAAKNYEAGRKGENWNDPKFLQGETAEAKQTGLTGTKSYTNYADNEAHGAAQDLIHVDTHLGQEIENSLKNSDKMFNLASPEIRNSTADLNVTLQSKSLNISKTQGLEDIFDKLNNIKEMTPVEAKAFKDQVYDVMREYSRDNNPSSVALVNKLGKLADSLNTDLRTQVPEYAAANDRYKMFRTKISDQIISPDKAATFDVGGNEMRRGYSYTGDNLDKSQPELKQQILGIIEDIGKPGADRASQVRFNKIKQGIEEYKQYETSLNKPESADINGILGSTVKRVENAAVTNEAKGAMHKQEPMTPPSTSLSGVGTAKAVASGVVDAATGNVRNTILNKTSNLVGRIQGGIEKGKLSPSIQDSLDKLGQLGVTESVTRNALLNTLMQNHTIRNYLNEQAKESK
jgi:hypothetical protein